MIPGIRTIWYGENRNAASWFGGNLGWSRWQLTMKSESDGDCGDQIWSEFLLRLVDAESLRIIHEGIRVQQ